MKKYFSKNNLIAWLQNDISSSQAFAIFNNKKVAGAGGGGGIFVVIAISLIWNSAEMETS